MTDQASADNDTAIATSPYAEGSVWIVSLIRVKQGMCDEYLKQVVPLRKKLMDQAIKSGVVVSHKILHGFASDLSDWDLMIMVEYKNWAALDGLKDKLEAVNEKILGSESKAIELMEERSVTRRVMGDKVLQEIVFL